MNYRIFEWLIFFYIYGFMGWCWETAYVSVRKHKFINRGFMFGPFLPIYGTGAIMMLVVSAPFRENLVLTYVAGVVGATVLELVTGMLMELFFKVRYWDYSRQKFNFKGYICLSSSMAWGFFTIFMTFFWHRWVEAVIFRIPSRFLQMGAIFFTIYVVIDFAMSFHGALNLKTLLSKIENAREELATMQRRLDAMIAFSKSERFTAEDLRKGIEERLNALKNSITKRRGAQRGRVISNPTMVSRRYQDALNELKQLMEEFRRKK